MELQISAHCKLQSLLSQQKSYWKQRGQIKWATLGDAGTKLFHAIATTKHMQNSIASIHDNAGDKISNHDEKAKILFDSFRDRLGTSQDTSMRFNINSFIQTTQDLSVLEAPFTMEEIEAIIGSLPSNKSLGPNDFNKDFMKKSWNIIAPDFFDLCIGVYNETIYMQSINGSYITLIPKKDVQKNVGYYRPISLSTQVSSF